jgi:23S rRNA (uracil1939-C5)-methyltransferase
VADALAAHRRLSVERPAVVPSPREFRYRNRVSFTLVRLRAAASWRASTRSSSGPRAGHRRRVSDAGAAVAEAWSASAGWGAGASRLPSGLRLRLTLRATARGRTALLVQGGYGPAGPTSCWSACRSCRRSGTSRARDPAGAAGGRGGAGGAWQDEELDLGGGVFLQVNRGAAALLEDHVLALAGDVAGCDVVDAYCGVGLHARRLARGGARVTGIELDPHAVAEARRAAPDGARFRRRARGGRAAGGAARGPRAC